MYGIVTGVLMPVAISPREDSSGKTEKIGLTHATLWCIIHIETE